MFRTPVQVRDAVPDDSAALVEIWDSAEGAGMRPAVADSVPATVARVAADPAQRLVVATLDDQVIGAVHLSAAPLSPVHEDAAVFVSHLHVRESWRRHGAGHALIAAAVAWAEDLDVSHVLTAAAVGSRDANRFMARLGLAQVAVMRGASTAALRSKLPVESPAAARVGTRSQRNVGQVLVQRRSMRRARTRMS